MVVVGLTEKALPVPTKVPPHEAVYHLITVPVPPPPPTSDKELLCPLQIMDGVAVADVGSVDFVLTVIPIVLELVLPWITRI